MTPLIKKEKRAKGSEDVEEGEVTWPLQQPSAKEAGTTRAQQKKNAPSRASKGTEGGQHSKASVWKPSFVLSSKDPVMDDTTLKDLQKGRSGIFSECLEKALLLPEDMHELQSLRKCEVFLSLKRDLAKVYTYPSFLYTYTKFVQTLLFNIFLQSVQATFMAEE